MKYRKLSPSGDYTFGNGLKNFYINEPNAVGQAVQTRLLLFLGDWYLDTTEGTPYFSGVLGKSNQPQADIVIRDRTLNTSFGGQLLVTDITAFTSKLNPDTREYSVTETIDTIFGQAVVQTVNQTGGIVPPPVLNPELITEDGFIISTESGQVIIK